MYTTQLHCTSDHIVDPSTNYSSARHETSNGGTGVCIPLSWIQAGLRMLLFCAWNNCKTYIRCTKSTSVRVCLCYGGGRKVRYTYWHRIWRVWIFFVKVANRLDTILERSLWRNWSIDNTTKHNQKCACLTQLIIRYAIGFSYGSLDEKNPELRIDEVGREGP